MDSKKKIGVGMLGYAFMGKAHTNAFRKLPYFYYPPPAEPVLQGICGRNEQAVQEAAQRFGYQYGTTDWKKLINDPAIILADEPTGNLDSRNGQIVIDLLAELNRKWHRTVFIATHSTLADDRASVKIDLKDGMITSVP